MKRDQNMPGMVPDTKPGQPNFESFPDVTPRREGGDDALAESSPTDSRSDEKVIAREKPDETKTNDVPRDLR